MMFAGKLSHRIIIQEKIASQDLQTGEITYAWGDLLVLWAHIAPVSVNAFVSAQAEQSKVTARITVRYNKDINKEMRIYHPAKDKVYTIEGLFSDDKAGYDYLTIAVSEGVKNWPEVS